MSRFKFLAVTATAALILSAHAASAVESAAAPPAVTAATVTKASAVGYVSDPSAPLGSEANPIPKNSPTPVEEAYKLVAGGPTVVSNDPIPDTPQNRAKYGHPLSHGGGHTDPDGH